MKKKTINNVKNIFFVACIITVGLFFLFWALNSFRFVNGSYEEYIFSLLISRGDDVILFIGVFLTKTLCFLQRLIPGVNVFTLFLVISVLCSFTAINYVFLKKFQLKLGLLISLFIDCFLMNVTAVSFQWTHTAVIICLASEALVFCSVLYEKRKKWKIIQFIVGLLGVIISSQLRFDAAKVCLVFGCLFCLCVLIKEICQSKNHSLKNKFFERISKTGVLLLAMLGILGSGITSFTVSEVIKDTDSAYPGYVEYNDVRAKTEDYPIARYAENKEFYNSIGINDESDLWLLYAFRLDKDFFTLERLEAISQYSQEHDSGIQNIYMAYFRALKNKTEDYLGNGDYIYLLLGVLGVILLSALFLIFKIRNRIKPVFVFLFCVMWVLPFLYFGINVLINDVLLLLFFAVSILVVLIGNRYQYICVSAFSICIILLYNYMAHTRIAFRVSMAFVFPGIIFLILFFDMCDIRRGLQAKSKKISARSIKTASIMFSVVFLCFAQSRIGVFFFNFEPYQYDEGIVNFVRLNDDSLFFFDGSIGCSIMDRSRSNPILEPEIPNNSIHYGSWPISSHLYDSQLKENNIKYLHKEMINNKNRFFVISKYDGEYRNILAKYYNDHYSSGSEIVLQEVYSTDKAWVYRVVENKKES